MLVHVRACKAELGVNLQSCILSTIVNRLHQLDFHNMLHLLNFYVAMESDALKRLTLKSTVLSLYVT